VNDGGDAARAHDLGKSLGGLATGDVELDQVGSRDSLRRSVGEVIDDDDLLTALEEKSDHMRADVAGASSNENAHALSLHTIPQNRTETNLDIAPKPRVVAHSEAVAPHPQSVLPSW
jgi:hypothetical protein